MNSYVAEVETDSETGEQVLVFPDEMMEELGWEVDDTLEFDQDEKGNITIKNLSKEK